MSSDLYGELADAGRTALEIVRRERAGDLRGIVDLIGTYGDGGRALIFGAMASVVNYALAAFDELAHEHGEVHRLLEARRPVIVHRPPTWSRKIFAHTGRTETGPAPVADDDDLSERLKTAHARAAASYERTRELWLQTEGMLADNRVLRREVWESCHDRQPGPARQALLQRSAYARLVARLQTMPVIEQAKGIVMAQSSCGDAEAFDMLRRATLARAVRGSWTADGVAELPLFGKAGFPAVVHRAAGMVSQQCGCEITDALALLRARAFSAGRPAEEIAAGVLRGELRFH